MRDRGAAERLVALLPKLGRRPLRRARFYAVLGDLLLGRDDTTIVRALLVGLGDPDAGVRAQAAWGLGKRAGARRDEAVVNALGAHLADPSGAVRANALGALARLRAPPTPALLVRLAQDREPAVRANAARLGARAPVDRWVMRVQKAGGAPSLGADYVLLRVVDETPTAPRPAAVRIGLPDGLVEIALLDERGMVRDEGIPKGELLVDADPSLLR
jgi:HEAT repeat protein